MICLSRTYQRLCEPALTPCLSRRTLVRGSLSWCRECTSGSWSSPFCVSGGRRHSSPHIHLQGPGKKECFHYSFFHKVKAICLKSLTMCNCDTTSISIHLKKESNESVKTFLWCLRVSFSVFFFLIALLRFCTVWGVLFSVAKTENKTKTSQSGFNVWGREVSLASLQTSAVGFDLISSDSSSTLQSIHPT